MKTIVAVCGLLSVLSMLFTWIGTLFESAAWMRFGGGMLILPALMLLVGLLAAVVGLFRGDRKRRLTLALHSALMFAVVVAAVMVHVGLTGGV